jgi:hypothetical protein
MGAKKHLAIILVGLFGVTIVTALFFVGVVRAQNYCPTYDSGATITSCVSTSNAQAFVQGYYDESALKYLDEDHAGYISNFNPNSYFYYQAVTASGGVVYVNTIYFTQSSQSLGYSASAIGPYYLTTQVYDAIAGTSLFAHDNGQYASPQCPYNSPTFP